MTILSSEVIPKERLSAYQRWELATLEETEIPAPAQGTAAIDGLRSQARAAGHAEGYAAGAAQAADDRVRLASLIESLGNEIAGREQDLADAVLDLALALARKVVDAGIAVRRDALRPVIAAALEQLPQSPQRIRLSANPAEVEAVRNLFATEPSTQNWQIRPDAAIAVGGCRIETEQCEIDATVETRWARLLASLGRDEVWHEPAARPPEGGVAPASRDGAQHRRGTDEGT